MSSHRHRAIRLVRERAWQYPLRRDDDPMRRRAADGGVVQAHRCACGATRESARTLSATEYGEWVERVVRG